MTLAVDGAERSEVAAGKYRIVSRLGQGGTAEVYLAVADGPSGFQKLVVLKVLKEVLGGDPEFRAMFLSEARLAARLHHRNIVQTNEVLQDGGTPVIVMEYLEGQPLSQVIVRGKQGILTLPMQIRILMDALHGLHAAHELADFDGTPLGVVHRDVSPHNIFVTVDGHAKVLDFGIAKLERSLVETEVGTIKGKLRYMAPEQIEGEKLDRRADIYAAGVILWEALAGERMWKGLSEAEIRSRVRVGDLPMTETARSTRPSAFDRICRKALSLVPADRHPTALALADDLEAALSEQGIRISHRQIGAAVCQLFEDVRAETRKAIERKLGPTSMVRQSTTAEHGERTQSLAHQSPRWMPHRPGGRVAAAAAVVIALAILLVVTSQYGSRIDPGPSTPAGSGVVRNAPRPIGNLRTDGNPADLSGRVESAPLPVEGAFDTRISREGNRNAVRPSPKRPPSPTATSVVPSTTASNSVPNAGADCAHPFFVDGDGIKKFRPECR